MRTLSPRKSPSRGSTTKNKWTRDPSYLVDSWAPVTPCTSPFREEDPAHCWKPFGTNKVRYKELDAAVFSDRLDILQGTEEPTTPRSRFREREAIAEQQRERGTAPLTLQTTKQQTVQPYKVSVVLKLGGTQPAKMEQKARGYGDQFYSNIVTSKVSRDGIPIKPGPAVPEKTVDSRGVLLRRRVVAVTGSVMGDVTVDSLMNQHTGESIDTSCGVVATPHSAVVMAVTDFSRNPQQASHPPSLAAQEPEPATKSPAVLAEQPSPSVDWRRFSTDPAARGNAAVTAGCTPRTPAPTHPRKVRHSVQTEELDRAESPLQLSIRRSSPQWEDGWPP
jgi:hypothetical protein